HSPVDSGVRVPKTVELLRRVAGCRIAAFSVLKASGVIGMHSHPELGNGIWTCHLGLEMQGARNFLCVDGDFVTEEVGRLVVFDGSHDHCAVNAGTEDRAILYLEFDTRQSDG